MLAANCSLAVRYNALGEDSSAEVGLEARAKLEARLRFLEEKGVSTLAEKYYSFL
ncbi:Nucleolar protein 58 [Holothuria leucospilota]|uniref:Nucleolar protein 58 n=1 Tax=Holothuria leucospilota TaxID=206669 RepID=A0A9Q1B969_HOLLE|nr:Nucleolar protein 58 [Holothuria leucospilota]